MWIKLLSWIYAVLFLLFGTLLFPREISQKPFLYFYNPFWVFFLLLSLVLLATGVLFIPPISQLLERKVNTALVITLKIISLTVLLVMSIPLLFLLFLFVAVAGVDSVVSFYVGMALIPFAAWIAGMVIILIDTTKKRRALLKCPIISQKTNKLNYPIALFKNMSLIHEKKCVPCETFQAPMNEAQIKTYLPQVKDWNVVENKKITKKFKFKDFKEAMQFVNEVADIAEQENHHPDIYTNYSRVEISLMTHAIKGLSENDFIMAAKIDHI